MSQDTFKRYADISSQVMLNAGYHRTEHGWAKGSDATTDAERYNGLGNDGKGDPVKDWP